MRRNELYQLYCNVPELLQLWLIFTKKEKLLLVQKCSKSYFKKL